jgi:uncharacterized membrane protein YraQ (UPF0718 family)
MKNLVKKIGANWLFLIAVILLYLILGLWDLQSALTALKSFLVLLKRILPILGIVFTLIFISNLFLNPKIVSRYLGKGAGKWGWPVAIIAGIVSMGSIYLWYPLLGELKQKGMREALIAVFLYNRAVKVPLLPVMVYYFGLRVVVIISALMILLSVLNGLLVESLVRENAKTGA